MLFMLGLGSAVGRCLWLKGTLIRSLLWLVQVGASVGMERAMGSCWVGGRIGQVNFGGLV